MRKDPAQAADWLTIKLPPMQGPGSGKDAWRNFATRLADANHGLNAIIDEQSAVVRELQGEVALLREQIAARKPANSRARVSDETVARIERDLREKQPTRFIAKRYGVSAMTVSRIGRRMNERARQA